MINNFFKTYIIYILIAIILSMFTYIFVLKYQKNTLKNDKKTQQNIISELKKEIFLLKKNNKIDIVNTEIKMSTANTIEEIKKLKELDNVEESAVHNHVNPGTSILDGMFLIPPTN